MESDHGEVQGLGLLDIETLFEKEKITCQAEAEIVRSAEFGVRSEKQNAQLLKGYEIHMGSSTGDIGLFKVKRLILIPHSTLRTPN